MGAVAPGSELIRTVGRSGFFTLAFGAMVGSGWVVVLGDWLQAGGPGGSALGFVAGGILMILLGMCYGELAARSATAGAEFLYTLETFGRFPAFLVGWFLTFYAIAVCAFEAIALAWLLRTLFPVIALPAMYEIAGSPITLDALLIGLAGALTVATLHYRGAGSAIRFQNVVTYGFICIIIAMIICGFAFGALANLHPVFSSPKGRSWIGGMLWTFSTCAFFLNGWQTSLHAIEERRLDISPRCAIRYMLLAIGAAAVFYSGIIISSAMAAPWSTLIGRELPAAAAFRALGGGGVFGTIILVAAAVSLTKAWSACAWVATRLLFAQARYGLLPQVFLKVDPRSRAPRNAVVVVTVVTVLGMAMGRGAITPLVNMLSICAGFGIVLSLCVLLKRRRTEPVKPGFAVPGGVPVILVALVGSVLMVGIALLAPLISGGGKIPLEWKLLVAWGVVGIALWSGVRKLRAPVGAT
ncbi:MAG: APC family permease [Terriglobales bacterium]